MTHDLLPVQLVNEMNICSQLYLRTISRLLIYNVTVFVNLEPLLYFLGYNLESIYFFTASFYIIKKQLNWVIFLATAKDI